MFKYYIAGEPIEFSFGVAGNASKDGLPEDGWQAPTSDYVKGKVLITGLDFDASKGSKAAISVSLETYGKVDLIEAA